MAIDHTPRTLGGANTTCTHTWNVMRKKMESEGCQMHMPQNVL